MLSQLFETALRTCGVAWGDEGVIALALPGPRSARGSSARELAARLRRRAGERRMPAAGCEALSQAPAPLITAVKRIQAHLEGELDDLRDLPVALAGRSCFARRVYAALREVGPGETVTYGELGQRAGAGRGAARAVGRAMATNPAPLVVPCHRVLAARGPGQFSSPGGLQTKLRLLTIEGADLSPFRQAAHTALAASDPKLAPVIRRVGGFPLSPKHEPAELFDVLAKSVVHQQVSMSAGRTIFGRLLARFGEQGALSPLALARADLAALREVGVSRQKASYLNDLGQRVSGAALCLGSLGRLDDERVISELCQVRGIGRWTAEMFLIFSLGRPDVLPVGDLGLQQAVKRFYGVRKPEPRRIERLAHAWVPYRSAATWYLWRALEAGGL